MMRRRRRADMAYLCDFAERMSTALVLASMPENDEAPLPKKGGRI